MKIMFMGTPLFAKVVLEGLLDSYEVCAVVCQEDKEKTRKNEVKYGAVKELAIEKNIPLFQPDRIKNHIPEVLAFEPDLIVTCAYGQIIPKEILDYPKYGSINVHASLLPRYRGGAPIHHALLNGDRKTGITIMHMSEQMDAGDIITQEEIKIMETDTLDSLSNKLSLLGRDLLLKTIPLILNGNAPRISQNEELVTYAKIIKKEDEKLPLSKTSRKLINHIRALNSNPGAYLLLDNKRIKIYEAINLKLDYLGEVGEIVDIEKDGIIMQTVDGSIKITKIKPEGKNVISVKDYLNGINKDELLGKIFN